MKVQHQLSRSEYIEAMNNKYPKEVEARYTVGEVLGRGGYATGESLFRSILWIDGLEYESKTDLVHRHL